MSVAAVSTTVQQQQLAAPSTGAQPGSRAGTIIKSAAIGGVVGAAALAGLSFTALPFIGALSAPIAAAIGGVAGLAIGGIVGWLRSRSGGDDAKVSAVAVGQAATPPAPGTSGAGLPPALPAT
ncbi:MAG: hypothetical protein KDC46_13950 [Thermoleophilia bacterium]|nr:hypothetical protein [Thermoleophilia bacterium]